MVQEDPGLVAMVYAGQKDTVEQALYRTSPVGQSVWDYKGREFEHAMSQHQGLEIGECQSTFQSVPPPVIAAPQFAVESTISERTSAILSQGSMGEHESCKSSEPPTPSATLLKSESDNQKRKHVKVVVKEFRSEAQAGIPCKIYQKESNAFVTNNPPRFNTMSLEAEVLRFWFKSSEPSSSEVEILELSLSSINVFDYQEFKKQSSDLDNDLFLNLTEKSGLDIDTVETLQHQDPNALPLSVFLVSPEATLCIVLQDQKMMSKCRLTLQVLSNYFRDKALKATMAGA